MTLGCKVNQYETGAIEGILRDRGHSIVKLGDGCDVCILNTCAVTEESVRKSQKTIRRMKKMEPNALIAVCGCYTQLDAKTVAELGVDIISGTEDRHGFALEIEELLIQRGVYSDAGSQITAHGQGDEYTVLTSRSGSISNEFEELSPGGSENRTRALLKIQDGCNNFCTYCIVPYARGRSRSLSIERIIEYTEKFVEQGYKEIVIAGIEISSYGKDLAQDKGTVPLSWSARSPLISAIQAISSTAPNVRLRLGSLDPSIMTDEFCLELSKFPNLCNHFHLSVQSGSNEILQRMGRKYTAEQVLQSIETIRTHFSDCGITADLIVGFPGETGENFEQTLEFMSKAKLSEMHIFSYSQRPGTKAAEMTNQIDKDIKRERAQEAKKIAMEMSKNFRKSQIGKAVEVLFEQEKNGFMIGHSSNYLEIKVKDKTERNVLKKVKITEIKNESLYGEII